MTPVSVFRKIRTSARWIVRQLNPVQTMVCGYATYIFCVFVALCIPFVSFSGEASFLDHLFMAASAVSTTGLATVSTVDYNFWGQLVLFVGFQVGGLGYMTFGSVVILASRGRVSQSRITIGKAVFSMPEHFEPIAFLKRAVVFTFVVELLGAICLYLAFTREGSKVEEPLWSAIFHSVSAFCTAGFSIFPNGLEDFRGDFWVTGIISLLSILGAVGFIVLSDLYLSITTRGYTTTLTSKIILVATFGGIFLGTSVLYFEPSIHSLPANERVLAAFFQATSALTTVGFNTHPIGAISASSVMVVVVLMLMGASPSGTGGGLKCTSWSAGLAATWSAIHGRKETYFFGYIVPHYRIQAAFASFTLYLFTFAIGCFLLLIVDGHRFEDVIFEVASALGTVGLSRGITGDLSSIAKWVLITLMFIGRVGVMSLGLAALAGKEEPEQDVQKSDFVV